MQAIKPLTSRFSALTKPGKRGFTTTWSELHLIENKLKRKINAMKMVTEHADFTYEPPNMIYDKSTGDVQIIQKEILKKPTIIQSYDDMTREKAALLKEMGIKDGDLNNHDIAGNLEETADVIYKVDDRIDKEWDFDPSKFNVFSRDQFRIDIGLIIMRPPIFLHMRDPDIELLKMRSKVMNEYYCDFKKYVKEYAEVTQLNESVLANNSYASDMNLDNYPTHEMTDPVTGETTQYCAASKQFSKVDPTCTDYRSLHYAAEDRTYFVVRNKFTKEWQFPVGEMMIGSTILRAKQDLFTDLSDSKWVIKYTGNLPQLHTLRDFTLAEQEEERCKHLKGVRTYFFHANHWRGLPELVIDQAKENNLPYDDFAWLPKRKMNEFMTREYYDIFVNSCTTR